MGAAEKSTVRYGREKSKRSNQAVQSAQKISTAWKDANKSDLLTKSLRDNALNCSVAMVGEEPLLGKY
jgi:hypothetical protein